MYRSARGLSGTCAAWCNWILIKRGILNTGNMVNLGGSSEWSGYVEVLTTTFIASSSNTSLLSDVALSVVTKQLNNISSDCWCNRCVDVE